MFFSSEQALEIAEAPENGPDTKLQIKFACPYVKSGNETAFPCGLGYYEGEYYVKSQVGIGVWPTSWIL